MVGSRAVFLTVSRSVVHIQLVAGSMIPLQLLKVQITKLVVGSKVHPPLVESSRVHFSLVVVGYKVHMYQTSSRLQDPI